MARGNSKASQGRCELGGRCDPHSVESRFDALHAGGLTELIGREEELELLLRRWSKAKSGEGQVALVSGEPGIGKSRLIAALMERLANEPHTPLRYFCSSQRTDSAFYPIVNQMERAAGFTYDDSTQAKLDKLDALLAKSLTPPQDAALLADMLSLPNDGRYLTFELDPQQRRQKTLEALTAQLETLAQAKPVLMVFEDVHWIDPTSLEAVGRTVDRLRTLGVLLIVTYRPEFEPPWIGRPYVTALTLNRLGEREITAIIDGVMGNKALPERIRQDIVERTDGVPLFVEEMTKAVLETESEAEAAEAISMAPSPALAVPASLHASLMARLDRLGSAKEVAQIGAAIGREFSHGLLASVVASQRRSWDQRLIVSSRPVCCFGKALRHTRIICSNMLSFRMQPMARFCASRDAHYTLALPKLWKGASPTLLQINPNLWLVITPKPDWPRRPQASGATPDSGRWSVRLLLRPPNSLHARWNR